MNRSGKFSSQQVLKVSPTSKVKTEIVTVISN